MKPLKPTQYQPCDADNANPLYVFFWLPCYLVTKSNDRNGIAFFLKASALSHRLRFCSSNQGEKSANGDVDAWPVAHALTPFISDVMHRAGHGKCGCIRSFARAYR